MPVCCASSSRFKPLEFYVKVFALDAEENNIKVDIPFLVDELPPRRNTQYGLKDPP